MSDKNLKSTDELIEKYARKYARIFSGILDGFGDIDFDDKMQIARIRVWLSLSSFDTKLGKKQDAYIRALIKSEFLNIRKHKIGKQRARLAVPYDPNKHALVDFSELSERKVKLFFDTLSEPSKTVAKLLFEGHSKKDIILHMGDDESARDVVIHILNGELQGALSDFMRKG